MFKNIEPVPRGNTLPFLTCLASFLALNLGVTMGSTVGFLYFLPMLYLWRLRKLTLPIYGWVICLIAPLFYIASSAWSQYPKTSLKLGAEATAATICALVVSTIITRRQYISALFYSQLISVVASLISGNRSVIWETGEYALTGLFGSKNNFALAALILLLCSVTLYLTYKNAAWRLVYLAGALIAVLTIVLTVSAGALITFAIICGVVGLYMLQRRLSRLYSLAFLYFLILLTASILLLLNILNPWDYIFGLLGKNATLTGRTELWAMARHYISNSPLLGVGYQSFWVEGNGEAEFLWEQSVIANKSGFHFHNLYYAVMVELGYAGMIVFFTSFALALLFSLKRVIESRTTEHFFFFALMVMFASRIYSEMEFLAPFATGTIMLPAVLSYCIRSSGVFKAAKSQTALPRSRPQAAPS